MKVLKRDALCKAEWSYMLTWERLFSLYTFLAVKTHSKYWMPCDRLLSTIPWMLLTNKDLGTLWELH